MLVAIIGVAALGTEIGYLLYKHRQMQSAADAAALSGATAYMTGYPSDLKVEARAVAAAMGYTHGVGGATVTVNRPPLSGSKAGDSSTVEVIVSQPQTLHLVTLFRSGVFSVGARAVATLDAAGIYCMLALDPAASGAVALLNNAVITNPKCGVADNSSSSSALTLSENSSIAGAISVHGDWTLANGASLPGSPLIRNGPVIDDPYAAVQLQTIPACTGQTSSGKNNLTLNLTPGHFCAGWDFMNTVTLNLAPGAYYIDQKMNLKNNVTVNAMGGVTLIVNGNYPIDI